MTIRKKYGGASEAAFASYDWQDIADGSGTIVFKAFTEADSSSTYTNRLSRNISYTYQGKTYIYQNSTTTTNPLTFYDKDWDTVTFNQPRIVNGEAQVSFVGMFYNVGGNGGTSNFLVTVYHVDKDGNETSIGSVETGSSALAPATPSMNMYVLKIALARTLFKIDEKLRLNIKGIKTDGTGQPGAAVLTDPADTTVTVTQFSKTFTPGTDYGTSSMQINIPFKIDI